MATVLKPAALLPLIGLASGASAGDALPASGELDCDDRRIERCEYFDAASGLAVRLPQDWPMRRLRVSTETGPSASVRQPYAERWVVIDYVPEEPANPEVSLFQAAVIPRAAWLRIAGAAEAAPGTEVASSASRMVIAAPGRTNPYPPGSRDAEIYDALIPSLEEISLILTLRPGR
jgi:hypothetical protein